MRAGAGGLPGGGWTLADAARAGPSECSGDLQQVCAQELSAGNNTALVDFVMCQDDSQAAIPENGGSCAEQAGLDSAKLQACASGSRGAALLRQSIAHTDSLGIDVCCTVYVQKKEFCVHNGEWQQCSQCGDDKAQCLIDAVCAAAPSPRPKVCSSALRGGAASAAVEVTSALM